MRVLVVGAFDPCAVHLRQRKWLAPLGIELKVAVREKYWAEHEAVDWTLPADHDAVAEYARHADLLVYLPAIAQPWSSEGNERVHEVQPYTANAALFLFHGSVNAAANMQHYAEHYGRLGTVAATTLDYVAGMGCEFVPSIVDVTAKAKPRERGEALRVIHAPSDPKVCRTSEFRHVAQGHCQLQYMNDAKHSEVIRRKSMAHAGYDHLRGAFSINSLENAAIGLVNLVGMSDAATEAGERLGVLPDWPKVQTMDDVRYWLERLDKSERETAQWQARGYEWFQQTWHPAQVAERIADVYRKAAA